MGKRLEMHICPACGASVIRGDDHEPGDDLLDIRKRDAAERRLGRGADRVGFALNNGDLGPTLQALADRRMLLRMLDHEMERVDFELNREPRVGRIIGGFGAADQ